jgi:hypothetical protein
MVQRIDLDQIKLFIHSFINSVIIVDKQVQCDKNCDSPIALNLQGWR